MIQTLRDYLQFPFVQYALIVGALIALCSSLLGVTLVLKRFSFIGDGLSHVAFRGHGHTKQEYFATLIANAAACCSQGIEFVWAGEHAYPRDYPPLETEITVTGIFDTYYEGEYMYVQLKDAQVEWDV